MNPAQERELSQQIQQHSTMEYILIGDLRDLLEEPEDEITRKWMTAVLEALLNNLPCQFALQEQDGFLQDVLEEHPTWYRHVDELKVQQKKLFQKLRSLYELLIEEEVFCDVAHDLKRDLHDWITSLTAYHRHERRLVQSAYNLEIGGGD